ncbi:MAG: hypothetical protein K2N27_04270 [Ruminococcus sp.]|nr:hypothetical protein [Ruminococcus sp.]
MKKLSILLICACTLVSCDTGTVYISEKSYEIDGCTFDYKEYTGCERNDFEGVLKKDNEVICEYSALGYEENYPAKVVNLFDSTYYVENHKVEDKETAFYIAKDGTMYPDFVQTDEQVRQEQLEYISDFLRENITEQEIADIFDKCGYDNTYILEIYGYSEKD